VARTRSSAARSASTSLSPSRLTKMNQCTNRLHILRLVILLVLQPLVPVAIVEIMLTTALPSLRRQGTLHYFKCILLPTLSHLGIVSAAPSKCNRRSRIEYPYCAS
jgi:hypothetical protein